MWRGYDTHAFANAGSEQRMAIAWKQKCEEFAAAAAHITLMENDQAKWDDRGCIGNTFMTPQMWCAT